MKKSILLILIALFLVPFAKASHVIGGDISYQWVSQNNYTFKLRYYRDDINGLVALPATMTLRLYDAVTHQLMVTTTLNMTSQGIVQLGDPCYQPDPNVVRIEEGIYDSPAAVFVPDNPNGYYMSTSISARNSLAINVQTGGNMMWFAMMSDPALGQNSSPDFGNYPADAYFCITGPKLFTYPIIEPDGDSLAYKLTTPLAGSGAGTGAYPFYPGLNYQAGYSLANMVGGAPAMNVNATTGLITAAPTNQGFFTFALTIEEFRDTTAAQNGPKVKIGEVRRDVQYASLNCTSGNPPQFLNVVPTMGQTLQIDYNREYCKDLIFSDLNATDTLYIEMISPIFDSGAYVATVPPDINGNLHYYYDWNGTAWNDSVVIPPNSVDTNGIYNIGTVAQRFCWTPGCDEVDSIYPFQVNAYSLGCDGKSLDSMLFNIHVVPPPANLLNPGTIEVVHGNNQCVNIVFEDSTIVDLMNINLASDAFGFLNNPAEIPDLPNNYVYESWQAPVVTGVPNNAPNHYAIATQMCWYPDCEHIGSTYSVEASLYSVDCPHAINDTIYFDYSVLPPFDSLDVIPNVITPNGDGMNDVYTLGYTDDNGNRIGGTSNPCEDIIKVEIFNRWGVKVFESEDPEFAWDGKNKSGQKVPDGTYFVLLHGTYGNETVTLDQRMVTVMGSK